MATAGRTVPATPRRTLHGRFRRAAATAALASAVASQLLPGPVTAFTGSGAAWLCGVRAGGTAAAPPATLRRAEEPRFSKDKLRAETEDPFSKVRLVFFAFGLVSTLSGFLFILPRLIGSIGGAPNAAPIGSVGTDLAINAGGAALFGFLTTLELDVTSKREQQKEEGALIARLQVRVRDGEKGSLVRLSDLRSARRQRSRRPVLCIGDLDFCRGCIETSSQRRADLDQADFLVVPILSTSDEDGGDRASLVEASKGLSYVALPSKDRRDWDELCRRQVDQVRSQGLNEDDGQVIVVKKNGRVGTRFLGLPNWEAMTGEVNARVSAGLDTTNI